MLRLILGRAGTGKTALLFSEIAQRCARGQSGSFLIVPEQYSHEAERELAQRCGDTASLYAEVLSFSRLAHRVAIGCGGSGRVYMDKPGRFLQLSLALEQMGGALTVYGGSARSPEQMVQLLSALDELHFGCAAPDALRKAAGNATAALSDKLRDLALLQEALDALSAQSGADPAGRLDVLAAQLSDCTWLRGAKFYIDGFTDFTAQERRVIRALLPLADVTVCLTCDDPASGSEVFSLARRTARALRDAAAEDGVAAEIVSVPRGGERTPMAFLEENLFGWTDEVCGAAGAVRLVRASGVAAECELAAAEIRRLVRETPCRWRDIAVAVRGFEDYRAPLEEACRRAGVPLYASARTDIFTRPLPALVAAAFDILSDGWSYESVFTYLKTGLTGISRADCDALENYVLLWSLRGTAWTRAEPWRQHPDGFGGKATPESEALLEKLDALRRDVAAPLAAFERRGKEAADARGQCAALAAFWEDISLPEHLEERSLALEEAGELQTAAEYRQLWELMVSALEQCEAILGSMPLSQEDFGRLFRRMLSQYDVGTIPVALDRVTAGDFDRMRRRSIRHLLVLGASDDRLPRVSDNAGVFTETEREELRALDIELSGGDDGLDREFNLIYNVLTLPAESLYISRSAFSPDGSETRPSFVADRIARLFSLREEAGDMRAARAQSLSGALELACAGDAAAREYFARRGESARIAAAEKAAEEVRGTLSRESVAALYGREMHLTASRIDNFASCRFQYFLRYGLRAKPRQSARFDPPELGTFLHYLLEHVARDISDRGGFAAVDDDAVARLTEKHVREYVRTELEDFREKSSRFVYLFRRLTETARRIVLDTARELRVSDFRPLDFELNFSNDKDMPPVSLGSGDGSLVLNGVADRVDGWEHGGKLYLRVVDYKSGVKSFSLTDVWYGMGLQMLLYLFTLEKNGAARYGKEIVPSGVLYVPARDVLVSAPERLSDEDIVKEKAKRLRRSGLLLAEDDVLHAMEHGDAPQYLPVSVNRAGEYTGDALASAAQLGELSQFLEKTLTDMARELRHGSIAADPWFKTEQDNACRTCDFYDACRFSEKTDGWRFKASLKAPEFWARLEKGEEDPPCR